MAKPLFVLADLNKDYILPLEIKLIETYKDRIRLEIIDDPEYLDTFFSGTPRIDVLIISESILNSAAKCENVGVIYKLTEKNEALVPTGSSVKTIYKYSNIQKIFGEIEYGARQFVKDEQGHVEKTKIVLVYSALGGIGKTTIALGLCANLVNNHKKVLYVDAENLQDFTYYMDNKETLHTRAGSALAAGRDLYTELRPYLRNDGFDYLPPLRMAASAMDIRLEAFRKYVIECKKHVAYDYVIIDTDTVFNDEKDNLLQIADRVVLLIREGEYSKFKTELLVKNFASTDGKKYLVVCNMASAHCSDRLEAYKGKITDAVVHEIQGSISLDALRVNKEIEQISYLL